MPQPPRFFITHSWKDIDFARRLGDDLRANGLDGFLDAYSIKPGDIISKEITHGLEACDVYVPILSYAALKSPWCEEEINAAIMLGKLPGRSGRPRIIPILVEDCQDAMPIFLLTRLYIKFEGRYEAALQELLTQGFNLPPIPTKLDPVSLRASQVSASPSGQVADENILAPAVARPVNLSFEAFAQGYYPAGWFDSYGFVDGVSRAYRAQVVDRPDGGSGACVLFTNPQATANEFGSLMQRIPARRLAGKAIRLEAEIRTYQAEEWAGLWLRADGDQIQNLVFDNMSKRPIKGSRAWRTYVIEVQLPPETTWLNYGLVLVGRGMMWADNFRLMVWTSNGTWVDV